MIMHQFVMEIGKVSEIFVMYNQGTYRLILDSQIMDK